MRGRVIGRGLVVTPPAMGEKMKSKKSGSVTVADSRTESIVMNDSSSSRKRLRKDKSEKGERQSSTRSSKKIGNSDSTAVKRVVSRSKKGTVPKVENGDNECKPDLKKLACSGEKLRKKNEEVTNRNKVKIEDLDLKHEPVACGDIASLLLLGEGGGAVNHNVTSNDPDSDNSDWEQVQATPYQRDLESRGYVEVTLDSEELVKRGKKKSCRNPADVENYIRRQIQRTQRELQSLTHRCHVLCLLARSRLISQSLNNGELMAVTLSLIPSPRALPPRPLTISYLRALIDWLAGRIRLESGGRGSATVDLLPPRGSTSSSSWATQLHAGLVLRRVGSPLHLTALAVLMMRALGLECRLVVALHPLTLKLRAASSLPGKDSLSVHQQKESSCKKCKSTNGKTDHKTCVKMKMASKNKKTSSVSKSDEVSDKSSAAGRPQLRSGRSTKRPIFYSSGDDNEEGFAGFDERCVSASKRRRCDVAGEQKSPDHVAQQSLDTPCPASSTSSTSGGVKGTRARDVDVEGADFWAEVYLDAEQRWVPIDVVGRSIDSVEAIQRRCTSSALYVVGWDNTGHVKDLAARYDPRWATSSRAARVSDSWWAAALEPWIGQEAARDRLENQQLQEQLQSQPFPKSIAEFKNHPLYALKRHLLKFEAIYPESAPPLGFIGKADKREPVFARECVVTLRSRETWLKQARVVPDDQTPYKVVKARPKWDRILQRSITDRPLEVFGFWQTGAYVPPTAVNGKVPRNDYGNVELFKPCMLPKGTVHLPVEGLSRLARKLDIDCAPAMVGWDFHGGGSHPVFQGYVVCQEFEQTLMCAWEEEQRQARRRELEKREKRVLDNWKRLIRGLMIREKLASKYDFSQDKPADNNSKSADSGHDKDTAKSKKKRKTAPGSGTAAASKRNTSAGTRRAAGVVVEHPEKEVPGVVVSASQKAEQVQACLDAMALSRVALSSDSESDDDLSLSAISNNTKKKNQTTSEEQVQEQTSGLSTSSVQKNAPKQKKAPIKRKAKSERTSIKQSSTNTPSTRTTRTRRSTNSQKINYRDTPGSDEEREPWMEEYESCSEDEQDFAVAQSDSDFDE